MEELKFYLAVLRLMFEEEKEDKKPRRWRPSRQKRFHRYVEQARGMRTRKSLRGSQTQRPKTRHATPH